jgi:hypothetical protein
MEGWLVVDVRQRLRIGDVEFGMVRQDGGCGEKAKDNRQNLAHVGGNWKLANNEARRDGLGERCPGRKRWSGGEEGCREMERVSNDVEVAE